jgi:hypothetical protein
MPAMGAANTSIRRFFIEMLNFATFWALTSDLHTKHPKAMQKNFS